MASFDSSSAPSTASALVVLGVSIVAVGTTNPLLTLGSVLAVPVFFWLLWRPGEPPVLLFVAMMQWLQVATKVFHADLVGVPVTALHHFGGDIELAVWLALIAIMVLAFGMRLGAGRAYLHFREFAQRESLALSPQRLFVAFLAAFGASLAMRAAAWVIPALQQPVVALSNFKWVIVFLLAYVVFAARKSYGWLAVVVVIEVVSGFTSFFSGFRVVFTYLITAYLAASPRISLRRAPLLVILIGALLVLSLIWTAVKVDFRDYVSQGTRMQVILVGWEDRAEFMLSQITEVDLEGLQQGLEDLAARVAYVDYFAAALNHVPNAVPHEGGALLGRAMLHVVTPRVFFPDKPPPPHDTDVTAKYTGLSLAAVGRGTSISLGYVADNYVDFGEIGMFVPILAFGFLIGRIYRYFVTSRETGILVGYGLAIMVLYGSATYEMEFIKHLGSLITMLFAGLVFQKLLLPILIPLLVNNSAGPQPGLARRVT